MAIFMVAARLAQAVDDRDEAAYVACLADTVCGSPVESGALPVAAAAYARAAILRASRMDWTHHLLSNPVVEVEPGGCRAIARIDGVVLMGRTGADGVQLFGLVGGRYRLGLVRLRDAWRIDQRAFQRRYAEGALDDASSAKPRL